LFFKEIKPLNKLEGKYRNTIKQNNIKANNYLFEFQNVSA